MDIILLLITFIGAIGAVLAAIYAYNAWLKPAPSLHFREKKAEYINSDDGRYIYRVRLSVTNISSVPAYFDKITIEDFPFPETVAENITVTVEGHEYIKTLNRFLQTNGTVYPGKTLNAGDSNSIDVKIGVRELKENIKVSFHTPNRSFETSIQDITELPSNAVFGTW